MIRLLIAAMLLVAAPAAAQDTAHDTAKVEDLRAIREIKRLQAEWGYLAFAGDWKGMAALGTEDVSILLPNGRPTGRAAFAQALRERMGGGADGMPAGRLNARIFTSPVITLSETGDRATARWRHLALTGEAGKSADWRQTTDVIEYRKTAEGWRIAFIRPYFQFAGPYATGFTHTAETLQRAPFHYTPEQAGQVVTGRAAATPRGADEILAEATLLYFQSRAQNLANAFGFYLDRGMYDDVVDLFAPDATIDVAGQGVWKGPEGVRKFLGRFGAPGLDEGELNEHAQLMPLVSVAADGSAALVRVVELGQTGQHGGEGQWSLAINTFLLQPNEMGRWRIAMLHRRPLMRADYRRGWADPLPAAEPIGEALWPSGPPQQVDTSYPAHPFAMQGLGSGVVFAPRGTPGKLRTVPDALARVEAFDATENVIDSYGGYIDELKYVEMTELFAPDGWREQPMVGAVSGREAIFAAATLARGGTVVPASSAFLPLHAITQPYITPLAEGVPTQTQARSRLMQWNSAASGGGAGGWISGVYEWQVKKVGDTWRIAGMDLDYTWLANYKDGWTGASATGGGLVPSPELRARYKLDAPLRGAEGFPYPRIETVGFHYANPVSDRAPPRPIPWTEIEPAK
ncbi:nuclear transport factor 2 family protein [Tsuneonella sp. HG222]